jgi:uncharacterized protein with HEPN domain
MSPESAPRLADYLTHMREAAMLARTHVDGMSKAVFLTDKRTQQAVILNILVIGEAATRIAQHHPQFVMTHAEVPWQSMRGMRNKMAHGYFDIDLEVVWETVQRSLPELVEKLSAIHTNELSKP